MSRSTHNVNYLLVSAQVYFLYMRCVPFIDPCEPDMTLKAVKTTSATRVATSPFLRKSVFASKS